MRVFGRDSFKGKRKAAYFLINFTDIATNSDLLQSHKH